MPTNKRPLRHPLGDAVQDFVLPVVLDLLSAEGCIRLETTQPVLVAPRLRSPIVCNLNVSGCVTENVTSAFRQAVLAKGPTAFAGSAEGPVFHGQEVAFKTRRELIYVHPTPLGSGRHVEGGSLRSRTVTLFQDVVSVSTALLRQARILRDKEGAAVTEAWCIVSYGLQGTIKALEEAGILLRPLLTLQDIIGEMRPRDLITPEDFALVQGWLQGQNGG